MWGWIPFYEFSTYNLRMIHSFWPRKIGVYIGAIKANLILFEIIYGLKVNFYKSLSVCVNMEESWLLEAYVVLNCKVGQLPFTYMGLPIGGNWTWMSL